MLLSPRIRPSAARAHAAAAVLSFFAVLAFGGIANAGDAPGDKPGKDAKAVEAPPTPSAFCLDCHSKPDVAKGRKSLLVKEGALSDSVHSSLDCVDCHSEMKGSDRDGDKAVDPKDFKHHAKTATTHCEACHDDQAKQYATSVHGLGRAGGDKDAARCGDCHGSHDIRSPSDEKSQVYKRNLPVTCARCHDNAKLTGDSRIKLPNAAKQYMESIHGLGLTKMGLVVAPSCNDCHGVHNIRSDKDPESPINRKNIPKTCAKCHVGIEETYAKSIHGEKLAAGDEKAPVCSSCHSAHQIADPTTRNFKLLSDERCGSCHKDRLERYRETYHGKAIQMGRSNVAACFDCHGYHNVRKASDPASQLAPANKLQTCQKCHPTATANFTDYMAHADHKDRKNYPMIYWVFILMTSLVLGVFGFFGLHTVLWLVRSVYLYMNDSKTFREAKLHTQTDQDVYVRFRPFDRFLHLLVISSFLILVITGMPLKFYYADWAKVIFRVLGGAEVAQALHRFGAIITATYFSLHVISMVRGIWARRGELRDPGTGKITGARMKDFFMGPDSMMPTMQDAKDFWAHQKWFFGRGPKPQFDRWTYWEKFDYLAVFWGVFMIGLSGLVMWFPAFFTRLLPGWAINLALVIHSDEALLATGFIFTFHFFNVHFRIEKFPMDSVIFSGRISRAELKHERGRWLDRMEKSGELDQRKVGDEWEQMRHIIQPIGFSAFLIGVALIALIYWAMAARLTGN